MRKRLWIVIFALIFLVGCMKCDVTLYSEKGDVIEEWKNVEVYGLDCENLFSNEIRFFIGRQEMRISGTYIMRGK